MTKEESVQKFKDAQDSLIGQVYDDGNAQGLADGQAMVVVQPGGITQEQFDAAVKAAKDADAASLASVQAADAQVLADAVAVAQADHDSLAKQLADAGQALADVKTSDATALQAAIDAGTGAIQKMKDQAALLKASIDAILGA